jgi:hypothetical protein
MRKSRGTITCEGTDGQKCVQLQTNVNSIFWRVQENYIEASKDVKRTRSINKNRNSSEEMYQNERANATLIKDAAHTESTSRNYASLLSVTIYRFPRVLHTLLSNRNDTCFSR